MAGSKSLSIVVLCFLLVVASSQELSLNDKLMASCKWSVCYKACRATGMLSGETCAKNCNCRLTAFVPNEMGRKVKMAEVRAVLEDEEEMMEELSSLNDKLTGSCKYQPCYRACRAIGGSKQYCSRKCNCTQLMEALAAMT